MTSVGRPWVSRATWAVLGLGAWAVLATAAWLRPDARGFGTHQQLGLPPCAFQAATHVPSPGCGLTTSFANMAHLHVLDAFRAHLMGPLLFLLTVCVAVMSPWAARRALPLSRVLEHPATATSLVVTLGAGMITFGARLLTAFAG